MLIVGAGPTGLLTANLLGTYGIDCLVIERNAAVSTHPKAILLDDEGLRALQAAGLADEIISRVILGYGARYYAPDGTCFAKVDAPVTAHGFPRRNSFLQPDLEKSLLKGLQRFPQVSCFFSTELQEFHHGKSGVNVRAASPDGPLEITAQILLACDGGRSTVREQLGIGMLGRTDSRDWVVVDTVNDPDGDRFSKFFCDPARPMVSIPAPAGGRRYEYMIMPGEDPDALSARERVRQILSGFRSIPDEDMTRAVVYTFHARIAERLQDGPVLLLGDAAHLSPPFAGQGMNAGLRDAFNVAWKVAQAVRAPSRPQLLATYEMERRGPIEEMIDYAVSLGEIVMPVGGFDEAARSRILDALIPGRQGALQPKPQAAYQKGWLFPDLAADQSLLGCALPQPLVMTPTANETLLDTVLGSGFALLAAGPNAATLLQTIPSNPLAGLSPRNVALLPAGEQPRRLARGDVCVATDNRFLASLVENDQLLLVRPDRFVAAQIDPESVDEALAQITNHL